MRKQKRKHDELKLYRKTGSAFKFALISCLMTLSQNSFAGAAVAKQEARKSLVANGTFAQWKDGLPVGWDVSVGATDGARSPESHIDQGDGMSLKLSGDANTRAWRFLAQTVDVNPGDTVKFEFKAQTNGLKREGFQKDNCFVGFVPTDKNGQRLSPIFFNVNADEYRSTSQNIHCPENMRQAEIWIFLSKTGTLQVSNISVSKLQPADSFEMLVDELGSNYSFFELKKIDWAELTNQYRERATRAKDPAEFAKVVSEMLAEFHDLHTWVMHAGRRYQKFESTFEGNSDFNLIAKDITDNSTFRGMGIVGTTRDGFAYVNLRSLSLPLPLLTREPLPKDFVPSRKPLDEILNEIVARFDAPGMIIDLRRNGGGNEEVAKEIAGLFVDAETEFAKSSYRVPGGSPEFSELVPRSFRPTGKESYDGPVVCLIGPGTVSSAEAMTMMFKSVPGSTLIGKPTRGASGNPRPVVLPNGVEVWFSRWRSHLPDGTCIEGVGVMPDVKVNHEKGSDLAYEKALEILQGKRKSK